MHQALFVSENKSIYIINLGTAYYRQKFNKLVASFMKSGSNYLTICEADEAVNYLLSNSLFTFIMNSTIKCQFDM